MPFRSEKQRKYLWMNHPEIAQRWTAEHGSKPVGKKKNKKISKSAFGVDHGEQIFEKKLTRRKILQRVDAHASNILDEVDVAMGRKQPWQARRRAMKNPSPPVKGLEDLSGKGKKIVALHRAKGAGKVAGVGALAGSGYAAVGAYEHSQKRKNIR